MTRGALEGVLVADFSRVLAGPYATMLLADLGADVVKVEHPDGDETRSWGPPWAPDGTSTYFLSVNRNKRSVVLDLRTDDGLAAARALAARADVVVENLRPGAMARLGLGYEDIHVLNPRVVYGSVSGFGSGAGASLPGYDLLVQAMGGLMSVTGPGPGEPTKAGVALVDVVTGLHLALGVVAALRHRDATGEGQRVEVSLLTSLLSALVNQGSAYAVAGVVPGILGNSHPSIVPYEPYPTSEGLLVLAVGNDRQFRALVTALGSPGLADDERFATNPVRVAHREQLKTELVALLGARTAGEWTELLSAVGVPCGPVNDLAGAFGLAERLGLDPVVDAGGVPTVADPVGLSATPPTYRSAPPMLGEHTAQVLAELGLG